MAPDASHSSFSTSMTDPPPCSSWNAFVPLPAHMIGLLKQASEDIDEEKYVALKMAAESLGFVNGYLQNQETAQVFVEKFMHQVVDILLRQPAKGEECFSITMGTVVREEQLPVVNDTVTLINVKGLKITLLDVEREESWTFLSSLKQQKDEKEEEEWPEMGEKEEHHDETAIPKASNAESMTQSSLGAGSSYLARALATPPPTKKGEATEWQVVPLRETTNKAQQGVKKDALTKKKKVFPDSPCFHGSHCKYIQNGVDDCKFFHSEGDLMIAANKNCQLKIKIPQCMGGWMLGNDGCTLKRITEQSGAKIWIKTKVPKGQPFWMNISGTQDAVQIANAIVQERIQKYEAAPMQRSSFKQQHQSTCTKIVIASHTRNESTTSNVGKTVACSDASVSTTTATLSSTIAPTSSSEVSVSTATSAVTALPDVVSGDTSTSTTSTANVSVASSSPQLTAIAPPPGYPSAFGHSLLQWAIETNDKLSSASDDTTLPAVVSTESVVNASFCPSKVSRVHPSTATTSVNESNSNAVDLAPNCELQAPQQQPIGPRTVSHGTVPPSLQLRSQLAGAKNCKLNPSAVPFGSPSNTAIPFSRMMDKSVDFSKIIAPPKAARSVTPPRPAKTRATDDSLASFLQEHATCLKGPPEAFYQWLVDNEDIANLADLVEAMSYGDYLRNVLQPGDGNVGVKGFKLTMFQKAAADALKPATTKSKTDDSLECSSGASQESNKPEYSDERSGGMTQDLIPRELICPLSRILMTNDPVIAADGFTYERAAIDMYFRKQFSEIEIAKRVIAVGSANTPQAMAIVNRGVVSPTTHTHMALHLIPNHSLRTMARDAASAMR